jgi:predicted nucleic acid-binding protein
MRGSVFFDTNILVYAFGTADPRSVLAKDLLAEGGAVSVQVLNEFAVVARRRLGMEWPEVQRALRAVRTVCSPVLPLTLEMHEAAMILASEHGLHVYDAMIVSAARTAGCTLLYSEDMQDGRSFPGGLTIRNPFS